MGEEYLYDVFLSGIPSWQKPGASVAAIIGNHVASHMSLRSAASTSIAKALTSSLIKKALRRR
jgi:hypothetical protein